MISVAPIAASLQQPRAKRSNSRRTARGGAGPIVVVGGSGFIGSNLADSFLREGEEVIVLDNLSRPGVEQNLAWLRETHGGRVHPHITDIREARAIEPVIADAGAVFHFAAQTAVTTSLLSPAEDFDVNSRGTLNVLEAVRKSGRRIPVIFASTNKVYGGLEGLRTVVQDGCYVPAEATLGEHGIGETWPLDFRTPYGCSKGTADQYVLDYARSFGIPTAVLRMSCIYGPHQFGTEDQGWVVHFLIRALKGEEIAVYGDGMQVRDILHVGDAVAAYRAALRHIGSLGGGAFNLGGGTRNAVSLNLLLKEIERIAGRPSRVTSRPWREGDQRYFVADTRKLEAATGWRARIGWRDGVRDLARWLLEQRPQPVATGPRRTEVPA